MEKWMIVVRGQANETRQTFRERIFSLVNDLNLKEKPQALKLVITADAPPLWSVIPFKKKNIAVISMVGNALRLPAFLGETSGFSGAYRVTEALPVAYQKTWADGEATPGVCLLTLFNQKNGLDRATFLDRWHNSHTPLSLRLHPLWNYSRNVVEEKLSQASPGWDGIVEEHFRHRSQLLNPFKFFGNLLTIVPHMIMVYRDTKSFLDYKTMETYLGMETHIRSRKTEFSGG